MKGGGALSLFIKYLGFGIWTSSWLPFAGIIQMYIQSDVQDKFLQIANSWGSLQKGMTMANHAAVYDLLSTRLQVASDMLAATPLVSLGLLTGSTMAMSSLANRWSGRDHVDEKQAAPDLLKNGASVDLSPYARGDAVKGIVNSDGVINSHSAAAGVSQNFQSAKAEVASAQAAQSRALEESVSFAQKHSEGSRSSDSELSATAQTVSERWSKTQQAAAC